MEKYRNNYNNLGSMSIHDLEDLVYSTSLKSARRAEEMLFGGLMPFFSRLFDENQMLLEELQYVKTLLQQEIKNKTEEKAVPAKRGRKPKSKSVGETISNEILKDAPSLFTPEALKNMADAMKVNRLDNTPEINIPHFKGEE